MGLDESQAMKRLIRQSVVREATPGLFYFDEEVFQSVRAQRRRMAFLMLVTILLSMIGVAVGE